MDLFRIVINAAGLSTPYAQRSEQFRTDPCEVKRSGSARSMYVVAEVGVVRSKSPAIYRRTVSSNS